MKTRLKHLHEVSADDRACFGGKCYALAVLARGGFLIPEGVCIGFDAYERFVAESHLRERIHFELGRKKFEDMRWEELWDLALRIRNMFINSRFPPGLKAELAESLEARFGDTPTVVRSSAAGEDSRERSFAGLHESYVNIRGTDAVLDHVKLVWASLWSDRALLYRQELGLSTQKSVMGVVVQRLVPGQVSGVVFSRSPDSDDRALIEAAYGLNQGLVDGTVEPDHWVMDRRSKAVVSHRPADRLQAMMPGAEGLELMRLDRTDARRSPLDESELSAVLEMAMRAEMVFGTPQDVEWTYAEGKLYTLQSRPITTLKQERKEDERAWYLSLTRSFDNLKDLRKKIEEEIIPGMDREASELEAAGLHGLSDPELAGEIDRRAKILERWTKAYRADCIPFAHGMRLFGQVYNDVVRPRDPYEFMELLSGQGTLGRERDSMLKEMAEMVRAEPELARSLRDGKGPEGHPRLRDLLDSFLQKYGAISRAGTDEPPPREAQGKIIGLVLEMAGRSGTEARAPVRDTSRLVDDFLSKFHGVREQFGRDLLDLARASYRWRDDDNIYLARVEAETARAVDMGRQRVGARLRTDAGGLGAEDVARVLRDPQYRPAAPSREEEKPAEGREFGIRLRQLTGLPAGPGIGSGPARVVSGSDDLFALKSGEVLVCDAIEPEMTLVVPLAVGIVERRGGMLIHGAIVAREYGIPCVTGVPEATGLIRTGDRVTVDGYLGIVIIDEVRGQQ
jgi:phosphohistidine swiveling domain-containing protein